MTPFLHRAVRVAAVFVWLGATAAGLAVLMRYDTTPGPAADAPTEWPADSALVRDPAGPTLVMLAHPLCDCTRASLGELAELMARVHQRPRVFVVFMHPDAAEGWEKSGLWETASSIPGVSVRRDDSGLEARRFRVQTSGQTLLYDAQGQLVFSGGTTGARGKPGDNVGRSSLVALLNGNQPAITRSPVFGCLLFGPEDRPNQAEPQTHGSSD